MNIKTFRGVVSVFRRRMFAQKFNAKNKPILHRLTLSKLKAQVEPYLSKGKMPPGGKVLDGRNWIQQYSTGELDFVIKHTERGFGSSSEMHGLLFNSLRREMLAFHRQQGRSGLSERDYILRFPKVYFAIGDFLVMKYVKELKVYKLSQKERDLVGLASIHASQDVASFNKQRLERATLQAIHFMPVGFVNGKVVLYVAVDSA